MSIYIVSHKKIDYSIPNGYTKIFVGSQSRQLALENGGISDSDKIEISQKNSHFSELTAQYWIWKNTDDEIKGLVHYRRLLKLKKQNRPISFHDVQKILKDYDVIVSNKIFVKRSIENDYKKAHFIEDLNQVGRIIDQKFPEYSNSFREVLDRKYYHSLNILIASSSVFDEYSKWLFEILFELESQIDISGYDQYQGRIFGFLSERLLDVWLLHQNKKIMELPVLFKEADWKFMTKRYIRQYLNRLV